MYKIIFFTLDNAYFGYSKYFNMWIYDNNKIFQKYKIII